MALQLKIPSMASPDEAENIKETILTSEPDARIDVDLDNHTVTIESAASEESIKQLITASGHRLA